MNELWEKLWRDYYSLESEYDEYLSQIESDSIDEIEKDALYCLKDYLLAKAKLLLAEKKQLEKYDELFYENMLNYYS